MKKDYVIPFVGLKTGKHEYQYFIDNRFFERKEGYSLLNKGAVKVDLILHKWDNMMTLDFAIDGNVEVTCDRCADIFNLPIQGNNSIIVKYGDETHEETDEIIVLSKDAYEIDISQYIYEFISLLVPLKKVHADANLCNKEVIEILKSYREVKHNPDPRWNILKKLYNN